MFKYIRKRLDSQLVTGWHNTRNIAMNYRLSRFLFPLTLTLALFLAACSSNKIYRSDYQPCTYNQPGDCANSAVQISASGGNEYHLGFVEYDDQGQLRDRGQMNAVLDQYYKIASSEENEVLLITFVHGWHHNAQPKDDNILKFRNMLGNLSATEGIASQQQARKKRKILGLYVGWRGEAIDLPVINNISFWDRKNTAHQVGQQGVSEVLLKLEEIVNVKIGQEKENPPPQNSRMVVIGHSFGGAVVFTSLQKILSDRFIDSRRGKTVKDDAKGFGDLVVLMNPAFEALRFASLYDLSQEYCRGYSDTQLPRLAILTSEADNATKLAFPAGRFFSTLFESHVDIQRHYCSKAGSGGVQPMTIKEGQADRHTVGHFESFQTHYLEPSPTFQSRKENYQIQQIQKDWSSQGYAATVQFEGTKLTNLGRSTPLNPYLNIKVNGKLIEDHNDIWKPEIIAFLRDLIVISTTPVTNLQPAGEAL